MIIHQQNLEHHKHCTHSFGSFVQALNKPVPSNTNAPPTLDGLYLQYSDNAQGGHHLLHLQINRIITHSHVVEVPITSAVINQVRTIAKQESMPDGLKVTNRFNLVLHDSDWIAGVDYEDSDDSKSKSDSKYNNSNRDSDSDNNKGDSQYDDNKDNDVLHRVVVTRRRHVDFCCGNNIMLLGGY